MNPPKTKEKVMQRANTLTTILLMVATTEMVLTGPATTLMALRLSETLQSLA